MDDIPGIQSILYKSASEIWSDEQSPSPELVSTFDEIPVLLEPKPSKNVAPKLDELTRLSLQPSQFMRLQYLKGQYFERLVDWSQAYTFYYQAFEIAAQHSDLDSMIVLSVYAGNTLHNRWHYRDALDHFEVALAAWREMTRSQSTRRIEPEITLQNLVSRQKWLIGEFDMTRTTLAQVLTKALRARGVSHSRYLKLQTAHALWTLGLLLRSESDMLDGNAGYLRTAHRRMRKAAGLYRALGTTDYQMGRFYVQIAEIYFDLAELHLQRGKIETARSARHEGLNYVTVAKDFLAPGDDSVGKQLAHITYLRSQIMWPQTRMTMSAPDEIESDLTQIEYEAAENHDQILIAKVATLRAEWLISLGEPDKARQALLLALEGFKQGGMGMATRARRLLRRL